MQTHLRPNMSPTNRLSTPASLSSTNRYFDRVHMTDDVRDGVIRMLQENTKPYAAGEPDYLSREYFGQTDKVEIGAGAFGVVYKAWSPKLNKWVAVKVMSLREATEKVVQDSSSFTRDKYLLEGFLQMCQEAVLQSDVLDHENVVKVHDKWLQYVTSETGEGLTPENISRMVRELNDGNLELTPESRPALDDTKDVEFCLCMDLYDCTLKDCTLKDWLKNESKEEDDARAIQVFGSITGALLHIHKHEYTHNDLTLSNILVKKLDNGEVRVALADFGLATKMAEMRYLATRWGYQVGIDLIDSVRADMRSLGEIAFQIGSGQVLTDRFSSVVPDELFSAETIISSDIKSPYFQFAVQFCLFSKHEQSNSSATALFESVQTILDWYDLRDNPQSPIVTTCC